MKVLSLLTRLVDVATEHCVETGSPYPAEIGSGLACWPASIVAKAAERADFTAQKVNNTVLLTYTINNGSDMNATNPAVSASQSPVSVSPLASLPGTKARAFISEIADIGELNRLLALEKAGKSRKIVTAAIGGRIRRLEKAATAKAAPKKAATAKAAPKKAAPKKAAPRGLTIAGIKAKLSATEDIRQVRRILKTEKNGPNRRGAVAAIEAKIAILTAKAAKAKAAKDAAKRAAAPPRSSSDMKAKLLILRGLESVEAVDKFVAEETAGAARAGLLKPAARRRTSIYRAALRASVAADRAQKKSDRSAAKAARIEATEALEATLAEGEVVTASKLAKFIAEQGGEVVIRAVEIKSATCPRCDAKATGDEEIGDVFGFRSMGRVKGNVAIKDRKAQSYCRKCRNAAAGEKRAEKKLAAVKQLAALLVTGDEQVARAAELLGMTRGEVVSVAKGHGLTKLAAMTVHEVIVAIIGETFGS